jgi:soluble lytic murein transglycosylase-like protein
MRSQLLARCPRPCGTLTISTGTAAAASTPATVSTRSLGGTRSLGAARSSGSVGTRPMGSFGSGGSLGSLGSNTAERSSGSVRLGARARALLSSTLLLLLGLACGLGAQARELLEPANPQPRPGVPGTPGAPPAQVLTQAATQAVRTAVAQQDEAAASRAAAELVPAGTARALAATTTPRPAGTFTGYSDELPTAAEPPPGVAAAPGANAAAAAPATPPSLLGALLTATCSLAAAADLDDSRPASLARTFQPTPSDTPGTAAAPAPVPAPVAAASAPPPPPMPQPPLGFDAALGVPRTRFGKLIYQTASHYALNPLLMAAMVGVESDFNPRARSRKGALGLMQMLPSTARRFGLQRRRDLFNPRKNLELAGRYLRWLVARFGEDPARVLAAYNAGEGAVDRFGGVPPFAETRDYVQRIFSHLGFTALLDVPIAATAAIVGGGK